MKNLLKMSAAVLATALLCGTMTGAGYAAASYRDTVKEIVMPK